MAAYGRPQTYSGGHIWRLLPFHAIPSLIHYGPSCHIRGGPFEVDRRRAVAWAGEKLYPEGHHCSSSLDKD